MSYSSREGGEGGGPLQAREDVASRAIEPSRCTSDASGLPQGVPLLRSSENHFTVRLYKIFYPSYAGLFPERQLSARSFCERWFTCASWNSWA